MSTTGGGINVGPLVTAVIGARHVQAILLTVGFLCCYAMRVCMSVAVVAMVDDRKSEV